MPHPRSFSSALLLAAGLAAVACGDDPFGPKDAPGTWDLQTFNGTAIPGTAWVRFDGDSVQASITSASLTFATGTSCTWLISLADEPSYETDDCSYTVSEEGAISVVLTQIPLSGTADGDRMTLTDNDLNVLTLRKR